MSCTSGAGAINCSTVDANQEVVRLGADVDQALGIWNSEFELYEVDSYIEPVIDLFADAKDELPMVVTGNFNGDPVTDVVLMGSTKTHQFVLLVVSNLAERKYEVIEVVKSPPSRLSHQIQGRDYRGISTYLSKLSSSTLRRAFEASAPRISREWNDGFQIEVFLSAATTAYYFDGHNLKPFSGEFPSLPESQP